MDNYYELLGVDSKATTEQIRTAYRVAALKAHPDKVGGNAELMKKITSAKDALLSGFDNRSRYDDILSAYIQRHEALSEQIRP